jgi:WD40 repeat protein
MQPLGKQPSYQSMLPSGETEPEAGPTRAPASAVNAIMGRLGLARTQDEPEANEATLTSNLADPSWAVRVSAVQKLGKMGKQAPLGLLLAAIRDEQSGVRVAAARALSRNPRQAAISALVAALEDHEWLVRAEVALALGEMREQAPLEPLLLALQDQDATVRASAAKALGSTNAPKVLAPLNQALQDEDWSVREAAALALARLDLESQASVPSLLNARMDHDPAVREAAETGLLQIYPDIVVSPPPPSDSLDHWLERIDLPESDALTNGMATMRALRHKSERQGTRHGRKKRGETSASGSFKWPLKAIHTAEGVLAAVIITSLFIVWLAIETQPRSTQGQGNPNNTRSITFTTYRGHDSKVERLAWSPDGQNIASADSRGNVLLWQASTGKTLSSSTHRGTVLALTWFDMSTVLVAYAEPEKELQVVELELNSGLTGASIIFNRSDLADVPTIASWSSDRQMLAFDTGKGNSVEIWNVMPNQKKVASIQEKHTQYTELAWSPDNAQLATLSTTGLLEVWSSYTGQSIASLTNNHLASIAQWVSSGSYPSGRLLVDSNSTLYDWSYGRHKGPALTVFLAEQTYNLTNADGLTVSALSISPDSSLMLLATSEGAVQTRDMHGGSLIYLYTGHSAQVNDIEWSPIGQHIATASTDTTVRVWQEP